MVERGFTAESQNLKERALALYRHAIDVIQEASRLKVSSSGLGIGDSIAVMKQELNQLHEQVTNR